MPDRLEWTDRPEPAGQPAGAGEDALDLGGRHRRGLGLRPSRRPLRTAGVLVTAAALAGGLAGYLVHRGSDGRTQAATVGQVPPRAASAAAGRPAAAQAPAVASLATVQALAADRGRLTDIVRPVSTAPACPVPDRVAGRGIDTALRHGPAGFAVSGQARTLDQYGGMCAVEVLARDAAGTVLVLDVVAPGDSAGRPAAASGVATRRDSTRLTVSAAVLTRSGWAITAGTFGPAGDAPAPATLLRLARQPTLRW